MRGDVLEIVIRKNAPIHYPISFASQVSGLLAALSSGVVFFLILKLVKMLRFNKRINLLSATLTKASYPLKMLAFVCGKSNAI